MSADYGINGEVKRSSIKPGQNGAVLKILTDMQSDAGADIEEDEKSLHYYIDLPRDDYSVGTADTVAKLLSRLESCLDKPAIFRGTHLGEDFERIYGGTPAAKAEAKKTARTEDVRLSLIMGGFSRTVVDDAIKHLRWNDLIEQARNEVSFHPRGLHSSISRFYRNEPCANLRIETEEADKEADAPAKHSVVCDILPEGDSIFGYPRQGLFTFTDMEVAQRFAEEVGEQLGIPGVKAECSPDDEDGPFVPIFEAVLKGFDGGTDKTDHLIKWIKAPDRDAAVRCCEEKGWEFTQLLEIDVDPDTAVDANANDLASDPDDQSGPEPR